MQCFLFFQDEFPESEGGLDVSRVLFGLHPVFIAEMYLRSFEEVFSGTSLFYQNASYIYQVMTDF